MNTVPFPRTCDVIADNGIVANVGIGCQGQICHVDVAVFFEHAGDVRRRVELAIEGGRVVVSVEHAHSYRLRVVHLRLALVVGAHLQLSIKKQRRVPPAVNQKASAHLQLSIKKQQTNHE